MANTVLYGFLAIFALFCNVQCDSSCLYSCVDEYNFEVSGQVFECQGGLKCNTFDANNDCKPCIAEEEKCKKKFTCPANENEVTFGDITVPCPAKHHCNKKGEENCMPCIFNECTGTPIFQCDPKDPMKVIIMSIATRCQKGTVCNAKYEPPCDPCIKPN